MEQKRIARGEINFTGIMTRTTNAEESDPATARIPGLWQKFYGEALSEKIPNKKNTTNILAAYTDYESDHTGKYSLIIGCEVENMTNLPEDLISRTVPAAEYLRFPVSGPLPQAIVETWMNIWQFFSATSEYQRAYTTDFEFYGPGEFEVEIYIAVK